MTEQPHAEPTGADHVEDAPPPDKETPEDYENEGGAEPQGPVAIT